MENSLKELKFKKHEGEEEIYKAEIKVHDVIDVLIIISKYHSIMDGSNKMWRTSFITLNDYDGFNISDIPGSTLHTKYGFETFEKAKEFAIKHYSEKMNYFMRSMIVGLQKYYDFEFKLKGE